MQELSALRRHEQQGPPADHHCHSRPDCMTTNNVTRPTLGAILGLPNQGPVGLAGCVHAICDVKLPIFLAKASNAACAGN